MSSRTRKKQFCNMISTMLLVVYSFSASVVQITKAVHERYLDKITNANSSMKSIISHLL